MAHSPSQAYRSYLASGFEEECAALAPDIPQAYPEHPMLQDVGELTLPPAGDPQGTTIPALPPRLHAHVSVNTEGVTGTPRHPGA